MSDQQPDYGTIVGSASARQGIYRAYTGLVLAAAVVSAFFLATSGHLPEWLVGVSASLTVLGAPVGALAAANVKPTP